MNQRFYLLLPLLIICLSIPSGAAAQYSLTIISGDGQTGYPGQRLAPFVVEVRDQNGLASEVFVTFIHDNGLLSDFLVQTGTDGRAQSTLTLGRRTGTTRVTVSVGGDSEVFEARAIAPPSSSESSTEPETPPPPEPMRLLRISGGDQQGLPGETLMNPFVVEVRNQDGEPSEGIGVIFYVLTGGGSLSTETVTTDSNGRAQSSLTLGSKPGTNRVQVNFSGTNPLVALIGGNSPRIVFRAEATTTPSPPPPMPTTLAAISGDNQNGLTGEALLNPFVVEVRGQYDNPLGGVPVTFALSTGGGSLSPETGITDANGRAESTLTLGSEPGTNTVKVSAEDISQTAVFSAEASLPPPMPTTLAAVSGDNQNGLTGEALLNPFVVEVRDQYDAAMEGVTVTFTLLTGGGSLSTETPTTDANGQAETTLTLGNEPGEYTLEVSVEGITQTVTFNVIAELLQFDLSLPAGLNLIHIPLKVRAVDGMPAGIESVSDLYDALGGADTLNWLIAHDPQTQTWHGYFGDADRGSIADRVLTDQTGILISIKTPISVRLGGDALGMDGTSTITLTPGLNLVGLPLQDSKIMRVSDLFALEGVGGVIAVIVVTDNGEFRAVGRADDPGDIPVTGGQGFILIARQPATIPIIGDGWQNTAR